MVDESEFRQVLHSTDAQDCPFGKAILALCCGCSLSRKRAIAEREVVICTRAAAREQCCSLYGLLRRNSSFALKQTHADEQLTHAGNMKVQCGGLHGLQQVLDAAEGVVDVVALVAASRQKFGGLEELPYSRIIQSVAAFQVRKPRGKE